MDSRVSSEGNLYGSNAVNHATCSAENRLRLKRCNAESVTSHYNVPEEASDCNTKSPLEKDIDNDILQRQNTPCSTSFTNENDSILDFKSPQSKENVQTKLARVMKSSTIKQKKKTKKFKLTIDHRKEAAVKERKQGKNKSDECQLSIESSFFKSKTNTSDQDSTNDLKTAHVCPLCFKTCKDVEAQALHMKICAVKNNISTRGLLEAIELQKRQADERKSMGLLTAPIIQDRKKPMPRKLNVDEESDLQLALALSKSLQEATELQEIVEVEELARTSNPCILDTRDTTCKGQWEKFGFRAASLAKSKRRKANQLTVLQIRSEKERNYILTERISEILIGNESITQNFQEGTRRDEGIKQKAILKSSFLQNLRCTNETLWSKTSLTPKQKYFYVRELSEHITSQEKELEELNNSYENTIEPCKINDLDSEHCEKEKCTKEEQLEEMPRSRRSNSFIEQTEEYTHKRFVNTLVTNWRNALNDSSASDLIIFVKDNKHIWTHKLVFFVRCSNILLDVKPNTDSSFTAIKEKICWSDTSYNIALAFLEFIYCGAIKKYSKVLEEFQVVCSLRNLARKYKVQELFIYLQNNTSALKQSPPAIMNKVENSKPNKVNTISPICRDNEKLFSSQEIKKQETSKNYRTSFLTLSPVELSSSWGSNCTRSPTAKSPRNRQMLTEARMNESPQRELKSMTDMNVAQHSSMSPDLFDDSDDVIINSNEKCVNRMADIESTGQFENDSTVHLVTPEGKTNRTSREGCIEKINIITSPGSVKSISPVHIRSQRTNVNDVKNRSNTETLKSPVRRSLTQSLLNTPRSTKFKQNRVTGSSMKKTKSDLSIYIEKAQRENAMSDSASYFDDYPSPARSELNRNPFNINRHDDSDQCPTHSNNNLVQQKGKVKTKGLAMLDRNMTIYGQNVITSREDEEDVECSIRDHFNVESRLTPTLDQYSGQLGNNDSKNLIPKSIDSGEDSLEDAATIISSLSKNSTRKSTDNVDRSLKNDATVSNTEKSSKPEDIDSEEDNLEDAATIIASPTPAYVNKKITSDSDVDTDENEISMYTKYKRKKINNSIDKYRAGVKKCALNISVAQRESSENNDVVREGHADNEDVVAILSDIDLDNDDFTLELVEKRSLGTSNEKSQATDVYNNVDSFRAGCVTMRDPYSPKTNKSSDSTYSCDTEIIVNDKDEHCTPTKISFLSNQRSSFEIKTINKTPTLRSYKSDSNIELDGIRNQVSSITPIRTEPNLLDRDSPVLVSSSPEFNIDDFATGARNENQIDLDTSNITKINDFDDIFKKEVYLENVRIADENDSDTTSAGIQKSNQVEKRNAIESRDLIHENISSAVTNKKSTHNGHTVVTDPSSTRQIKSKENSTNISCARKLHKKSVSEGNFSINAKNYANGASTFSGVSNVSQCKCGHFQTLNTEPSPVVIRDNVTPPPDYNGMRTPELHRELQKYGLKLQKRSRAVKLLTYIYNGLHPEMPTSNTIESEFAVLSSEDGEPPAKKFNHYSSDINDQDNADDDKYELSLSQYSTQSPVNIIGEEMQLDDLETMNTIDNNPNIKEKFLQVIKQNQEIHNKILAYEPLCIESIHSLLKADGFKCKMNSLMDLLDEQCITFYCQENSVKNRTRKNKR